MVQQEQGVAATQPLALKEECYAVEQTSSTSVNAASPARMEDGDEVTAPAAGNQADAAGAAAAALEGQGESSGHLNRDAGFLDEEQAGFEADGATVGRTMEELDAVNSMKVEAEVLATAVAAKSNHSKTGSGNLAYLASAATASPSLNGVLDGVQCATTTMLTAAAGSGVIAPAAILLKMEGAGTAEAAEALTTPLSAATVAAGEKEGQGVCGDEVAAGAHPSAALGLATAGAASLEDARPAMVAAGCPTSIEVGSEGTHERLFLERCEKSIAAVRYQQAKAIAEIREQWAMMAASLAMELAKAKEEVSQILAAVQKEADLQVAELKHELEVGLVQLQARKVSAANPMGPAHEAE
jgi:hypothetical protein